MKTRIEQRQLDCGIEMAVAELPARRAVAVEFRILAGLADEPVERAGLTYLIEQSINKGTRRRGGRALLDAFDEIGARCHSWTGRESIGFSALVLPEFFRPCVTLHAEFLRTPTFDSEQVDTARGLLLQELTMLDDDPQALAEKHIQRQALGPVLGRHPLGEAATVAGITRDDVVEHWQRTFCAGRLMVTVAGAIGADEVGDALDEAFGGFGSAERTGRERFEVTFGAETRHVDKEFEQQQMAIAFPGVGVDDPEYPVQRIILHMLSGGMSSRLFTEVREKLGLVYWVGAWTEVPRGAGMVFVGASTKPQRSRQTMRTLLREIDRLGEDVSAEELQRAVTGIIVRTNARADITRAGVSDLAGDIFHHGHPVSYAEKLARVQAVTIDDVRAYLDRHRRDRLSVVTLGPSATEA